MIILALGANLPSHFGPPEVSLRVALDRLEGHGVRIKRVSEFLRTAPVPASDQPDFINAVASVETALDPWTLLALLHRIEAEAGRTRAQSWAARPLDLDLIDYRGFVTLPAPCRGLPGETVAPHRSDAPLMLPHPRAHLRPFVLRPLAEIAPNWRHPISGLEIAALLRG